MFNKKNFFEDINITKLVFFGFFLRIIFLIFLPQTFGDTETFTRIGDEIFSLKIIHSEIHMPGYGVWIKILNILTNSELGFVLGDILVSSLSIYIIYLISNEIFNDLNVAKISALIFAIYPFSIFYSISGLTETLFVFLFFSGILMLYKEKILNASVFFVLSIYVKSTADLISPFIIITFCIFLKRFNIKKTLLFLSLYFLIYVIFLSPWWYHNYLKYNSFVRLNLAANYHLYSGNNPKNKTGGGIGGVDVDHTIITKKHSELDSIEVDKEFRNAALNYMLENPNKTIKLSFKKFLRYWHLYPYKVIESYIPDDVNYIDAFHADEYYKIKYKIISILSYGFILILSLVFLLFYSKKYLRQISPLLITIFLLTLIHIITIASIRYRFPLEPILIIFASFVINKILNYKKVIK